MRGSGSYFIQEDAALAARSGQELLTGLLRCARCGRKLHIRYWDKHGTAARYLCSGDFETGGAYCLGFASRLGVPVFYQIKNLAGAVRALPASQGDPP